MNSCYGKCLLKPIDSENEIVSANNLTHQEYSRFNSFVEPKNGFMVSFRYMNMEMDELMEVGERVYLAACAACHMPNGEGIPGVFPALKGSPMALNDIPAHIDIVLNGKTGTAMQAFDKQLTLSEIAAVLSIS